MIKRVSVFTIPQETDPDAFWKYWKEVHTVDIKKLPSLRKYIIHRAIGQPEGDMKLWGMVETWWDSEEACRQAFATPDGKYAANDFWPRVTSRASVIMEEYEVEL